MDWQPAAPDIRVLLAGGNLWVLPDVMQVLVRTGVSSALARTLLADNGTYVVGYAGLHGVDGYARAAQALLARLNGADHGANVEAWRRWIATL